MHNKCRGLYGNFSEKSKRESYPWVKSKKKPGPKKTKKYSIEETKKIQLAASDKGSNQSELLTSSNACETRKEIGARILRVFRE